MIHFDSSYNNVRRAANAGAAIVENAKTGNEVQHFRAGQKVHYTLASPVCFFDGVIIDTYNDNGYFYYTVKYGGNQRVFRQMDIELDDMQEDRSTRRRKLKCNGNIYDYSCNADNSVITINGNSYKVNDVFGYAIQVRKTRIRKRRRAWFG